MNLYPPKDGKVTFEEMEQAVWKVINKEKDYPKMPMTNLATICREVYKDRIFALRFQNIFFKKKKIRGGGICRTGIVMVYNDLTKRYPWELVNSLKIERVHKDYGSTSVQSGYYYSIHFSFSDDTNFNVNAEFVSSPDFPKDMSRAYHRHIADMFTAYYNRVRSETMQKYIMNESTNKKVLLHIDLDEAYLDEALRRFDSATGIIMKSRRKNVIINREGITWTKGKKKKIKVLSEIKWNTVKDVKIARGTQSSVILFEFKEGYEQEDDCLYPGNWKLDPEIKTTVGNQRMHIVPVCWLNL
jgi:hypothetical protein